LLIASTAREMPSSRARKLWRRLGEHALRASMSMTARSAVEAPVTMLRVYCSCPGVSGDDELAPFGGEEAVGHVDGDALLALGRQPVDEQREIELRARVPTLCESCSRAAS